MMFGFSWKAIFCLKYWMHVQMLTYWGKNNILQTYSHIFVWKLLYILIQFQWRLFQQVGIGVEPNKQQANFVNKWDYLTKIYDILCRTSNIHIANLAHDILQMRWKMCILEMKSKISVAIVWIIGLITIIRDRK